MQLAIHQQRFYLQMVLCWKWREKGKRNLSLKELSVIISSIGCIEDTSHITPDFLWHCTSALQDKKSIIGKKA